VTLPNYREFDFQVNAELLARVALFDTYYETVTDATKREITGRTAQMGDYVRIDYKGFLDGVPFQGGEAKGVDLLIDANSGYIPGFVDGIVGKEIGATFDVPVKFPDDYHEKTLAGKNTVFTMTLHAIYDLTLTDEEVKKLNEDEGDSKTYAEMVEESVDYYQRSDVQKQLIQNSVFGELPESTYLYFYQDYESTYRMYAAYYGMTYEGLLQYFGLSDAILLEEAKAMVKEYVAVYALAQAEGLELTTEEFEEKRDAYFDEMIENGEMTEAEKQEVARYTEYCYIQDKALMYRYYRIAFENVDLSGIDGAQVIIYHVLNGEKTEIGRCIVYDKDGASEIFKPGSSKKPTGGLKYGE
jgi:FKBP-type peptidyl-prolyl cis-trans isomerase (trigger factor)